jgi:hypothetical protein
VLHAWPPQPLHGPHKEPVPEYNSDSDTAAGHASDSNPLSGFYSDSAYEFDFGSDPEDPESEDNTTEQPLSGPASGLVITSIPAGRIVCWPNRKPADLITRESRDVTNLDSLPFQEGTPLTRAEEYTPTVKDRYVEPERGGSEWESIKILLEGDGNSNKMNTASNTRLRLTTQVGQAHVATGVPLDLGTDTQPSDPRTQRNTKPRVYRPTPVRSVSTTGQTGPCW